MPPLSAPASAADLALRYAEVRAWSLRIAEPLSAEDCCVQTMPDVSPTKWHLAHTTWFFESFVLAPNAAGYRFYDEAFQVLFNSYYDGYGPQHPRPARGHLSRPSLGEIYAYRDVVDDAMASFFAAGVSDPGLLALVELGLQHEEQHQELMLMDIKHVFGTNPLRPAYLGARQQPPASGAPDDGGGWLAFAGGQVEIGFDGDGFAYDNEQPRHRQWLEPFELSRSLVSCSDWRDFVEDGGYRRPEYWLSDGWAWVQENEVCAPLYWECDGTEWQRYALAGPAALDLAEPVCHVSYFEADAYARWAGTRLPREAEWEQAVRETVGERPGAEQGNFRDSGVLQPRPSPAQDGIRQCFGDVWEWTMSPYAPYPGFEPFSGLAAEYNGKFMSGQFVLKGGSAVSPRDHLRVSYRNFFYPSQRWAFAGLRLARDS